MLVAAQLPFRAVLGVEIAEDWADAARANVQIARPRLMCANVRIDTADVLEWPVPDDLSVVYQYCPFTGDVFNGAMERIFASHDAHRRPLRLVYNYPWEHNALLASGRATVIDLRPSLWPTRPRWWLTPHVIVTYELHGKGEVPPAPLSFGGRSWTRAMERWSVPNDTRFVQEYPGRDAPPLYSSPA